MRKFFILTAAFLLVNTGIIHLLLLRQARQAPVVETPAPPPEPHAAGSEIRRGGALLWPNFGNFRTLDPMTVGDTSSSLLMGHLYEGLLSMDADLKLQPCLAEEYEVSQDGKTYTFYLRRDVQFHDDPCFPDGKGRKVTADDVVYSLTRLCGKASENFWLVSDVVHGAREYFDADTAGKNPTEVAGIRKAGRYDVEIELNYPFSPILYRLAMVSMGIVPREAVETYGDKFTRHPVGTGPFILREEEYDQDTAARLRRNPNYWRPGADGKPLPYIDEIVVTVEELEIQALNKFVLGEYDWCRVPADKKSGMMTDGPTPTLTGDWAQYKINVRELLSVGYYGFMMTKPPFGDNVKLRQALNYAIDRDAICRHVLMGLYVPANHGPLPSGIDGFNPDLKGYTYDPEKAKQLLAEAGYPNGTGLPEIPLNLNLGGGNNQNIAEAIQAQLKAIGVNIRLELKSWTEHQELVQKQNAVFFRYGWYGDYPDPENFLALFDSRKKAPNGPNGTQYENPEFDKYFQAGLAAIDPAERIANYRKAEEIVVRDAPWLFLFHELSFRVTQPRLHNLGQNALENWHFETMWLSE